MSDERNWEGASDEELQDGIDDGEEDALREYASRVFQRMRRAEALLHRWLRASADNPAGIESRKYETRKFLEEPGP